MPTPPWHWAVLIMLCVAAAVLAVNMTSDVTKGINAKRVVAKDVVNLVALLVLVIGTTTVIATTKFVPGYGWWKRGNNIDASSSSLDAAW